MTYTCHHCNTRFDVEYTPAVEGQCYGPAETCYPSEAAEADPDECPSCGEELDMDKVSAAAKELNEEYEEDDRDEEGPQA